MHPSVFWAADWLEERFNAFGRIVSMLIGLGMALFLFGIGSLVGAKFGFKLSLFGVLPLLAWLNISQFKVLGSEAERKKYVSKVSSPWGGFYLRYLTPLGLATIIWFGTSIILGVYAGVFR